MQTRSGDDCLRGRLGGALGVPATAPAGAGELEEGWGYDRRLGEGFRASGGLERVFGLLADLPFAADELVVAMKRGTRPPGELLRGAAAETGVATRPRGSRSSVAALAAAESGGPCWGLPSRADAAAGLCAVAVGEGLSGRAAFFTLLPPPPPPPPPPPLGTGPSLAAHETVGEQMLQRLCAAGVLPSGALFMRMRRPHDLHMPTSTISGDAPARWAGSGP